MGRHLEQALLRLAWRLRQDGQGLQRQVRLSRRVFCVFALVSRDGCDGEIVGECDFVRRLLQHRGNLHNFRRAANFSSQIHSFARIRACHNCRPRRGPRGSEQHRKVNHAADVFAAVIQRMSWRSNASKTLLRSRWVLGVHTAWRCAHFEVEDVWDRTTYASLTAVHVKNNSS